jgi:DNA polymerase IV
VEQRDRPQLLGKPVIVGGDPRSRGVVSAASYEARAFGVRSAMPSSQAYRLCPQAVFLPPDFSRYVEASERVMEILQRATPLVEPMSIDEAYLDLTGTERLLGDPVETARRLKREILEEVRLVASVGIGPSKLVAKLGSDHAKPNGFVVVTEDEVRAFLDPKPIGCLLGVGRKTEERLLRLGIRTIGSLARCPREVLAGHFGPAAGGLVALAQGNDDRPVSPHAEPKSVSNETTFERDLDDLEELRKTLLALADNVARRLRKGGFRARTIEVKLRFADFRTILRSRTVAEGVDSGTALFRIASEILDEMPLASGKVRLIGVGGSHLIGKSAEVQATLFPDERLECSRRLESALDTIGDRFGRGKITRARLLGRNRAAKGGPATPEQ